MSDIEIARKAKKKHIKEIAAKLNLEEKDLQSYGNHIAKIDMRLINKLPKKKSKLILVTAITPTPAGEGKQQRPLDLVMVCVKLANKALFVCGNQVLVQVLE